MNGNADVKAMPVRTKGEGVVGRALNAGAVFGAAVLMAVAVWRAGDVKGSDSAYPLAWARLADDVRQGSPIALGMAACLLLILTPTLRMLVLAVYLTLQRRPAFAMAAALVVGILTAAFVFA